MKVLIVEDEMIISEDIAMTLEGQGYEVCGQAVDYEEAVKVISQNPPDLALIDINLKGTKDGIELAHFINKTCSIPFIYTSSLSDQLTIARAKETRPSTYLVKPFKDDQLFAAIEVAMSNFSTSNKSVNEENSQGEEDEKLAIFNGAIFIKEAHRYHKLMLEQIKYVQKSHNYLEIFSAERKFLIRSSMGNFIDQIGTRTLLRIHKSYAANPSFITEIHPTKVMLEDIEIPLSRGYADDIKKRLHIF